MSERVSSNIASLLAVIGSSVVSNCQNQVSASSFIIIWNSFVYLFPIFRGRVVTQSQPPNNQHSQIPRYPHPQHPKWEHSHQQDCNTTSAFLHRNIRTCPRKTKHLAYTTLVRPILEYASTIWDPHTASNIHKLETVQRRSARHIMHNYNRHASVTTRLQHLDLSTLQQRRQHSKIIMLYRITHQLASIPTTTYITPATRNTQHYILPYAFIIVLLYLAHCPLSILK